MQQPMTDRNELSDVVRLRVRVDQLEQDLSDLLHLYHGTLVLLMDGACTGVRPAVAAAVHFKLLQFPQGFRAGDPADPDRGIEDVSDLTFGEYIRLLENPKRWEKLTVKIDRKTFVEELKRVGRIRNDIMHFDP